MKQFKRFAALVLMLCLWATMLPMTPLVTAATAGENTLKSIEIISGCKTEYWIGETLDTTGLTLVAYYSDGSTDVITEGFTLSGFNNQKTGQQTVTVTYQGTTTEFTVTIKAPDITGIGVGQQPGKTEYWVGETLDTRGLTLMVFYSDGSVEEIEDGFTVTGFNSTDAGEQTLTAAYMGKTATFTVTVKKSEVIGINISGWPQKTEYWAGEALDTTGLTLMAYYSNGTQLEITEGFMVTGFNSSAAGKQTLTVSYMGATATFTVTVKMPEASGIEIVSLPTKTQYDLGQALDTAGLTLLVTYLDGSTARITEGFTVTGFNSTLVGRQTLTVWYGDVAVDFSVIVREPYVTGISVLTMPDKTAYWIGESLDTTGLTLTATYSDGSTREITEGFVCSNLDSSVTGATTVTVTYEERITTFTVTISAPYLTDIKVSIWPEKAVYLPGESLDTTGLTLTGTYSDGSTCEITEGFVCSGFDSTTTGNKTVTVTYEELTTTFLVRVTNATLKSITIATKPNKTEYWIGEELDTTGMVLDAKYSDGSTVQIMGGFTTSGFKSTTAGNKMVTVSYQGKKTILIVKVSKPVLTGIEITTQPTKTEYWVGEALDTTGLTVSEVYSDGKTVPVTGYTVSGFDSTTAGKKTVTVTYEGMTAELTVTVLQCEHTQVENKVCLQCGAAIAAVMTDGEGNAVGNYSSLSQALTAAAPGQRVTLQADVTEEDVIVLSGTTLDLNGYTLTAGSVLTYTSSTVTDSSPNTTGLMKITDSDGNMLSSSNPCLPVYDSAQGGYRFFWVTVTPKAVTGGNKYWFRVTARNFEEFYSLIQSGAQVQIQVKMTWDGQEKETYAVAEPAFTQAWAESCQKNSDTYITVSVTENEAVENFSLIPGITSGGVEIFGEEM